MVSDLEKYNTSVLGGIILSSFSNGNADLPSDFLLVENEIKCGTIDYLQGIENLFLDDPVYTSVETFQHNRKIIEENFNSIMNSKRIKMIFSPEIKKSLEDISLWKVNSGTHTASCEGMEMTTSFVSWKSDFLKYFKNLMGDNFQDSGKICSLPYSVVLHLKNDFLPNLSARERRDIEGIGRKVKIYRMRDLEGTNLNQFHYWAQ